MLWVRSVRLPQAHEISQLNGWRYLAILAIIVVVHTFAPGYSFTWLKVFGFWILKPESKAMIIRNECKQHLWNLTRRRHDTHLSCYPQFWEKCRHVLSEFLFILSCFLQWLCPILLDNHWMKRIRYIGYSMQQNPLVLSRMLSTVFVIWFDFPTGFWMKKTCLVKCHPSDWNIGQWQWDRLLNTASFFPRTRNLVDVRYNFRGIFNFKRANCYSPLDSMSIFCTWNSCLNSTSRLRTLDKVCTTLWIQ